MATLSLSVSIQYRHRWLGQAFIWLASVAVLFGHDYSEAAERRIVAIAWRLMGPKTVVA